MQGVIARQFNTVGVVVGGGQGLEEFIIVIERTWTQGAEPTAAVAMDRCAQLADIVDDAAGCELTWTAVVLESIRATLDEKVLFGRAKRFEQDDQVSQFGRPDQ